VNLPLNRDRWPTKWLELWSERAAILLAPLNASRHGHGILDDERSIAVREARYLLEEIERHFAKEPVVRH